MKFKKRAISLLLALLLIFNSSPIGHASRWVDALKRCVLVLGGNVRKQTASEESNSAVGL